jgi:uncharacterized phage protein (TIGR01671 family)
MREIKFRAWIKDAEKMVTVYHWHQGDIMDTIEVSLYGRQQRFLADEYELMQYTGLKDKNGKEIYEGDIVRTSHFIKIGVIEYWSVYHSFEIADILYGNGCIGDKYDWSDIEIIGNIYEHPNLLEQ